MSNEKAPDDALSDLINESEGSQNEVVELNILDFYNNIKVIDNAIQDSDNASSTHLIEILLNVRNDLFLDIAEELFYFNPTQIH